MNRRMFFGLFAGLGAANVSATPKSEKKVEKSKYKYTTGIGSEACELVRALGLDPCKTQSVHLNIDVDDAINAEVRQLVTTDDINRIIAVVDKKYVLCYDPRFGNSKVVAISKGKV